MKRLYYSLLIAAAIIMCWPYQSKCDGAKSLPEDEVLTLKKFFGDFRDAFNLRDVRRVEKMAGRTWRECKIAMSHEVELSAMEIIDVIADNCTNVVTKCIVTAKNGISEPAFIVFAMAKVDGAYSICKATDIAAEELNHEVDKAYESGRRIIKAINEGDILKIKGLIAIDDVADFRNEMSSRGLEWILVSIDKGIRISKHNMEIQRISTDKVVGWIPVPCSPNGTNILRKVLFKDGKIDRAAPPDESPKERRRRAQANLRERLREMEEGRLESPASQK